MTNQSSAKPTDAGVLTINGGSSSIKFALFEVGDSLRRILKRGIKMKPLFKRDDALHRVKLRKFVPTENQGEKEAHEKTE